MLLFVKHNVLPFNMYCITVLYELAQPLKRVPLAFILIALEGGEFQAKYCLMPRLPSTII